MRALFIPIVLLACSAHADERQASELSGLLDAPADQDFAKADSPREFVFPDDHGPHPDFRNEWWYFTGNLDSDDGDRFGYELTIFRFSLTAKPPVSDSAFRTNQIFIAHLAVTDVSGDRFLVAERYSRGAAGLAGARAEPFRVWIDAWSVEATDDGAWRLTADDDSIGVDLLLRADKEPVLNGQAGLSRKSDDADNASYYYSVSRLSTVGTIRVGDKTSRVDGASWLDREWSSSALAPDQVGWDWFALQLDDQSEIMFYSLRKQNGVQDRNSAGTLIRPDGTYRYLSSDDVIVRVRDTWESPAGGRYPSRWILSVPSEGLELTVAPVMSNQELFTTVRYWEGAVDVSGRRNGQPIDGRGYVELTGYAEGSPTSGR